jgi:hypothetical protein
LSVLLLFVIFIFLESDLEDRYATESFQMDSVLHLSDIVMLVVNSLQLTDQTFLNTLKKRVIHKCKTVYKNENPNCFADHMFVIHNFRDLGSLEDVNTKIEVFLTLI